MTEQDLQNLIKLELSKHGTVFRVNNGGFYTKDGRYVPPSLPRGFSDLMFVKAGRVGFVEVKVKPNKPTPDQTKFIDNMLRHGCLAGVAYSVEDAMRICGLER